ncbi:hypothetical protein [Desulfitibacter alkalitolerans]|uniref:hypothetical protein n=1 Tax=Desulfitibacter alkalitolerans TaxID=264641 RepID=UPI00048341C4|nr:hypothetical protein [Desulfitibacter alkalitolerans]
MKPLRIALLLILILLFSTGCSLPFFGGGQEENLPIDVYYIMGTILDKPNEEYVLVGTSIISGMVRVSPVLWQQLQPGDVVETVITLNSIISANLPGDVYGKVAYSGPSYDTVGFVTNKVQDAAGYALMVGSEKISGAYYVDELIWNSLNQGDEVKVFYNLQGIQGIVSN